MLRYRVFPVAVGVFSLLSAMRLYGQTGKAEARVESLQRAAALIAQHDLTSAEKTLQPLLNQTSGDPLALNLLGVLRMQQGRRAEAENVFEEAIRSGHKIVGPHINLAVLYGADRPLEAIAELKEALTIAPGNGEAESALRQIAKDSAAAAMRAQDKDKALAILVKTRQALPRDAEVLYELGFIAFECGLYHDAEDSLAAALKIRPSYPEAMYALARTYLADNRAKAAEDEMRAYLAAKPEDASAEYGLGYILMAEQRLGEAKEAFEKSLAMQPEQTESVFQLGEIALQNGENDKASEQFSKVLARDPRHGGALTEVGVLAYRASKYEQAKTDLEKAVASAPSYQKAHYYYALTLSKLGQKADAEREFTIAKGLQKEHGAEFRLAATQP